MSYYDSKKLEISFSTFLTSSSVSEGYIGIETVFDMVYYRPRKYIDRSSVMSIAECSIGEEVTLFTMIEES